MPISHIRNWRSRKPPSPVLREFATREIAIKCAENQQLQKWLYDWYDTQTLSGLNPTDTETYNKLNSMSGSNFDVIYMQAILNTNAQVEADLQAGGAEGRAS